MKHTFSISILPLPRPVVPVFLLLCYTFFCQSVFAQDTAVVSENIIADSLVRDNQAPCLHPLELGNGRLKYPPCPDTAWKKMILRNQQSSFGRKFLRGGGLVFAMQGFSYGLLFVTPESISHWDRSRIDRYGQNMKEAFTKPPVADGDHWYVNYVGHPFQGSYYYNAYRSQGSPYWQCALLATAHSFAWEYLIESGIERPSIQDLIVTPVVGSFMGELFHFATRRMARNGFRWYEAAVVCIINPMFALNNGFKFAGKPKRRLPPL